jgi:hypothetical protein
VFEDCSDGDVEAKASDVAMQLAVDVSVTCNALLLLVL